MNSREKRIIVELMKKVDECLCLLSETLEYFLYTERQLFLLTRTVTRVLVWWLRPRLLVLISLISPAGALVKVSSLVKSWWSVIVSRRVSLVVALETLAIRIAHVIYFLRGLMLDCALSRLMCPSTCGTSLYLQNRGMRSLRKSF